MTTQLTSKALESKMYLVKHYYAQAVAFLIEPLNCKELLSWPLLLIIFVGCAVIQRVHSRPMGMWSSISIHSSFLLTNFRPVFKTSCNYRVHPKKCTHGFVCTVFCLCQSASSNAKQTEPHAHLIAFSPYFAWLPVRYRREMNSVRAANYLVPRGPSKCSWPFA